MCKRKIVLLILTVCFGLAGCGQDKAPEVSSVSIGKDGKIVHQIVGSFEQNYYALEELQALAADRVAEYCADNGKDSVVLESVKEEDGRILIDISYSADWDYSDFNHREMFVGTLMEAVERGYPLESVPFVTADGQPMELGYMEERDKKQIVIVGTKPAEELMVNTYGKVLYINQSAISDLDVSFSGKKSVHISYPAKEDTDKSVLSYIIFE